MVDKPVDTKYIQEGQTGTVEYTFDMFGKRKTGFRVLITVEKGVAIVKAFEYVSEITFKKAKKK